MGLTTSDYADQLQKLLPYGPAWEGEHSVLTGGAAELARTTGRADALAQEETDPQQTTVLLTRYEGICGLPDECEVPGTATIKERQQRLNAKIHSLGGINAEYYLQLLVSLGYPDATISNYHGSVFCAGSRVGASIYGPEWRYVWQVNLPRMNVDYMRAGSVAGSSLCVLGDAVMQCILGKKAPSHTILNFVYTTDHDNMIRLAETMAVACSLGFGDN
ncbi:YmfQ family protein [Aeromonas hydrophila]|uniref:YmfQ family protein n=1 Tax=Aeromonas hydrophila TaxID=644 RepID=UPI003F7AA8D0